MKRIQSFLCFLLILFSFSSCAEKPASVTGWQLENEEATKVCDGVTYRQQKYTDEEAPPYMVYILEIDPEKATLHTGTSNNNYELIPTEKQDVQQQMEASRKDGLDVVAAVNGDFFAISTSYQPTGLCIKQGKMISSNAQNRPYSAINKDGQYLISTGFRDTVDPTFLEMAVGGSRVILTDGIVAKFEATDDHANTLHPRTLAGEKADGTMLLVVVDGRQPELSNDADLTQCAELMRGLGAVNAINHDGGGSSTMILYREGQYEVKNSPSDGNLRKVYCSIQVVKK